MNWLLWILAIVSLGVPVGSLTFDRMFGIPARLLWRYWGIRSLIAFIVALIGGLITGNAIVELILWGIVSGILASAALDVVRLFGHHVLKVFPLDMPQMFGTIAYGLAPQLQRNLMGQMVKFMSEASEGRRHRMLAERLPVIAGFREPLRLSVVGAMQNGLAQLPEDLRQAVMTSQMGVLAEMDADQRRTIMATMDAAMNGKGKPVYPQPRGLPKLPMRVVRGFMSAALPQTWREAGLPSGKPILAGYVWHFIIGTTFAISYNLVFGNGTWTLAFVWGIFIWATMMVTMPPMMPLVKFPWPKFAIVPLVAHLFLAVPIGYVALNLLSPAANVASLLGALGVLP
ncbi:MAG: hypothetical protein ACC647_05440 [Anaerolineales bacterium]